MQQQVLVIHGGTVHKSYRDYIKFLKNYKIDWNRIKNNDWKNYLQEELGNNYEVICPQMPNKRNAKYEEWKIWFEKLFPFLRNEIIIIGNSLGGLFLAKYLSKNKFPLKIKVIILIASPFNNNDKEYLGDFKIENNLDGFKNQAERIILYHSKDDPIVPISEIEKYSREFPNAEKIIFKDRGHFMQAEFPELVVKIKSLK